MQQEPIIANQMFEKKVVFNLIQTLSGLSGKTIFPAAEKNSVSSHFRQGGNVSFLFSGPKPGKRKFFVSIFFQKNIS